MKSTPINAIQIEDQEHSLYLRILYLSSKYILKQKNFNVTNNLNKVSLITTLDVTIRYWHKKILFLLGHIHKPVSF